ncbi:MAG: isoprenoid biosynthesis glyoxalase ElbB [Bdellovibrionia bacterium]
MKKVAVVLAGCGHQDGAEITETVSLIIALNQAGAQVSFFAPADVNFAVIDHTTGAITSEQRNVLTEAARITRGQIHDLAKLKPQEHDALCFAGGSGVAKNLCNWASAGAKCSVHPDVTKVILEFYEASKPIGAICIAPVLLAKVLGSKRVTVTIGNDPTTAAEISKTGAHHEVCPVDDYITDRETKVVTTPAYMYTDAKPHLIFKGIQGLAHELVEWA